MPDESLDKEIDFLKQEIEAINNRQNDLYQRISALEKKPVFPKKQEIEKKADNRVDTKETEDSKKTNFTQIIGIFLIIFGGLLSYTGFGAVIGIPLLIAGVILVYKSGKNDKKDDSVKKGSKSFSFEEDVGIKWFARIGILALVLGLGFFIKYAIENNWIDHVTRILIGVVIGIGLIVFGEFLKKNKKYELLAKTVTGGGFALTYFTVYAAYHFKEYREALGINLTIDLIFLSVVVIFAIIFSLKDNSKIIACESIFLGYITALLSTDFELMTLFYALILACGLVIIVSYKKWHIIGILGTISSYLLYIFLQEKSTIDFSYSIFMLAFYFLVFSIQSFFLSKDKKSIEKNIIVIVINSLFFFILAYFQIENNYPVYTGFFGLALSLVCFGLFYFYQNLNKGKTAVTNLYLGVLYITITIPIQLDKNLVTIIWALETLFLSILFIKLKLNSLKWSSYVLGFITFIKTVIFDSFALQEFDLNNILSSSRVFAYLASILCFYLIYHIIKNNKDTLSENENLVPIVYLYAASFLSFVIISQEMKEFWISAGWSFFALIIIVLGIGLKNKHFRTQAIIIFSITILKVFIYDTRNLETLYRTLSYVSLGIILLLVSFIYTRYSDKIKEIL
ncbi:DUF2339 domain-containing protein [Candidatus Woesearchaeota archaeon]|nr:DUF2339 domain-containing protein [Candidatus Woesearchaeota archaeon]